jgi:thioredoxin-dependent peroxiredoxin
MFGNPSTPGSRRDEKKGAEKMNDRPDIRKGSRAPGFTLPASSGKTVKLDDFRGRKLLVYFFPKAGSSG